MSEHEALLREIAELQAAVEKRDAIIERLLFVLPDTREMLIAREEAKAAICA